MLRTETQRHKLFSHVRVAWESGRSFRAVGQFFKVFIFNFIIEKLSADGAQFFSDSEDLLIFFISPDFHFFGFLAIKTVKLYLKLCNPCFQLVCVLISAVKHILKIWVLRIDFLKFNRVFFLSGKGLPFELNTSLFNFSVFL